MGDLRFGAKCLSKKVSRHSHREKSTLALRLGKKNEGLLLGTCVRKDKCGEGRRTLGGGYVFDLVVFRNESW